MCGRGPCRSWHKSGSPCLSSGSARSRRHAGVGREGWRQRRRLTMPSHQSTGASGEPASVSRDDTYDLVSVLSHALQGAETARHYIQDADQAGDQELVQFFREAQDRQRHLASQAKAVLKQRLSASDGRQWNQETRIWNLTLMA